MSTIIVYTISFCFCSSDKHVFNEAAAPYQEALHKGSYTFKLKFKPTSQRPPKQKNRRKDVIGFNPPFNRNVKSNIGRAFISLVDTCFPTAGHKLRKVFNRNTIKLSYSRTPNMKQIIDGHNTNTLKKTEQPHAARQNQKNVQLQKKR